MAQSTQPKPWKRFSIDAINRQYFAALFDVRLHTLVMRKAQNKERAKYLFSMLWRLVLLPLTSTVYVFSRLALVFNPKSYSHNFPKSFQMLVVTVAAGAVATGLALGTSLFTTQSLVDASGSIGSAIFGGILMGAVAMIAFASLLHLAKTTAHYLSHSRIFFYTKTIEGTFKRSYVLITAPKHQIIDAPLMQSETQIGDLNLSEFQKHQKLVLSCYYQSKLPPAFIPSSFNQQIKPILTQFETMAKAHKAGTVTDQMLATLKTDLSQLVLNDSSAEKFANEVYELTTELATVSVVNNKLSMKMK